MCYRKISAHGEESECEENLENLQKYHGCHNWFASPGGNRVGGKIIIYYKISIKNEHAGKSLNNNNLTKCEKIKYRKVFSTQEGRQSVWLP